MNVIKVLFISLTLIISQASFAQELMGTILKDGKPQRNIRVWLKHNRGVAKTDKEGTFVLKNVLPSDTLVMGISTKYDAQLAIGDHSNIVVHLEDDGFTIEAELGEVNVTSSTPSNLRAEYISVITLKKVQVLNHNMIMREGVKDVYAGVQRLVPSARIELDSGGNKHLVIVRGRNSFRAPEPPLFIIDGIPYYSSPGDPNDIVNSLPIEDIAEISVDRDGTSYGSRGANGVVIIRTLKGSDR